MFRTTLASVIASTVMLSATTASAQNFLNPFTWFDQPAYNSGYCPNGNCGVTGGYRGNCPGGNCNLPGACANGRCNLPSNCPGGVCPTPNYGTPGYGGYAPNYRTQPYNGPQYSVPQYDVPQYGVPQYNVPQYGTPQYNVPTQYAPYSANRPMTRTPTYDRSVTPAGSFDWNTPTTARRSYNANSPFYP